jgi:hypothetical protein
MYSKLTIAFVIVFVLGAVACSTAFAEGYEGAAWTVGETIVKENTVLKTKEVTTTTLEDSKFGLKVECKTSGERKITGEGKGEITALTLSACKSVKSCAETEITALATLLPWTTQLQEPEGKEGPLRENITSAGLMVECLVAGVKIKDECTGNTSQGIEDVSGGVDTVFDAKSTPLACTQGGAETGVAKGTELDENLETQQVQAVPTYRMGVYTPLLGAPDFKTCEFVGIGEECSVEVRNFSLVPVLVLQKELAGTEATTRYEIVGVGCTFELLLAERRPLNMIGGICVDKVLSLAFAAGWTNFFRVLIQALPSTGILTAEAILKT